MWITHKKLFDHVYANEYLSLSPGYLGVVHRSTNYLYWYTCRDGFFTTTNYSHYDSFYFTYTKENKAELRISAFFDKLEDKLNLPANHRICFRPVKVVKPKVTNINIYDIIEVTPGDFWWNKCTMKRSLLTALLRCAVSYDREKDNFEEALYSKEYTKQTKGAVERFLDGYTSYGEDCFNNGWVSTFKLRSDDDIRKLLV